MQVSVVIFESGWMWTAEKIGSTSLPFTFPLVDVFTLEFYLWNINLDCEQQNPCPWFGGSEHSSTHWVHQLVPGCYGGAKAFRGCGHKFLNFPNLFMSFSCIWTLARRSCKSCPSAVISPQKSLHVTHPFVSCFTIPRFNNLVRVLLQ